MRIVIATSVYFPMINGVAVFSHNLAVGLKKRGHEVMVITPSQTKRSHTEVQDGVKVVYLKSTELKIYPDQIHELEANEKKASKRFYKHGLKVSIFPMRQIRRALQDFQPDVVHVQGSDPIGVSVVRYAKKHHIPVVTTEHNQAEVLTEPLKLPKFMKKPVNKALTGYFKNRQKKSDYVTMPTKLAIEHLFKGEDIGVPIEAVSNGVDLSAFKPGKAPESLYQKYQIPRDAKIALYVGRIDPEKKIGTTIKAFKDFLDKHKFDSLSKTLFLVVGDGVEKNQLIKMTSRLGLGESVRFLGRITPPELYNIYRLGDVFVTASDIETQGIVLIEAAAAGLPLIAVNAGAVREVCLDSRNGYLVEPGDVKGISAALTKILSDDEMRQKMAEQSTKVASRHSLERTVDRFLEIYEKLGKRV